MATGKVSWLTRVLAALCGCCPFCVAKRAWPHSWYGRLWRRMELACPCCRAYARRRAQEPSSEPPAQPKENAS